MNAYDAYKLEASPCNTAEEQAAIDREENARKLQGFVEWLAGDDVLPDCQFSLLVDSNGLERSVGLREDFSYNYLEFDGCTFFGGNPTSTVTRHFILPVINFLYTKYLNSLTQ